MGIRRPRRHSNRLLFGGYQRFQARPARSNLELIAWYAPSANSRTHPVGLKAPNQWLLFDILGNADEWTNDYPVFNDPPGPLIDPIAFQVANANIKGRRILKGGRALDWPSSLRASFWDYPPWSLAGGGDGFRLVRTLR